MVSAQEGFYRLAPHAVGIDVSDGGTIRYADRRFVFFHTSMFADLFKNMKDVAGPVIDENIEEFGEAAGHDIASRLDDQLRDTSLLDALRLLIRSGFDIGAVRAVARDDTRSQVEKLFGLGRYDGWLGPVDIITYEEGERAEFAVENTFEAYSYGETGETQCRFLQGVLKSMLEYFWDVEPLVVEETRCISSGDGECRMVVTREP